MAGVTEAKDQFSVFLNRATYGNERIFITSHGKPKAALIGLDDLERLEHLELVAAAIEADAGFEARKALEWEAVRDEL